MAEPKHEERDVNPRAVTWFGIGLALMLIFALFALWLLFRHFNQRETRKGGPLPVVGVESQQPPEPRLQASPPLDLKAMRESEDTILNHYAWIDPDKGGVRLPISRAMDLLVERGLPSRPQTPQTTGVTVPTESGMGPIMQREGGPLGTK